ncbi:MAG: thiamine ABC transporter substrate-binding protein [Micrococcales bacterium]|nr:thiamine ABC transporter substrate-binding protein [Actinomycetota bacterium]NCA07871.1 thiamine ABC transporter substrate-binding protein [Micrococcales bacterium]
MKRISVVIAAVFLLSACSTTAAKLPVTLIAHDSFVISDLLVKEFEDSTGYDLKIVRAGDAGAMTSKLVLTKDAPIADAVFGIDNTFAPVARENKIIDGELKPVDYADVCFNIDTEYFNNHKLAIPADWRELAEPKYRNLTVIENPNTSSTGLAFLASTYAAFPPATAGVFPSAVTWWLAFRDNGVKVASSWEDAYYTDFSGSAGKGKYPVVLSYSSSPADELDSQGNPRTQTIRKDCFRQTEYVGVLKNTGNPQGAQALVKFMLSKNFQRSLPESMYVYPIDQSVSIPQAWLRNAAPAITTIGEHLDIAQKRDNWLGDYNWVFDIAP